MSITVSNLSFGYDNKKVLFNISFHAASGELFCIIGPNGVGKSTLFRCILGLLKNYSGTAKVNETDIRTLSPKQLARKVAYVPQSHASAFHYSVLDMTLMGTTALMTAFTTPKRKQIILAEEALERLGIYHLKDRDFMRTSGGERQLVLIARAIAQQARVLIMDEPTANLDYGNQIRVLEQVKLLASDGYTIIQSTHHPDQAFLYGDRVLALKQGRVISCGTPRDVMDENLIHELYGIESEIQSLYNDKIRVCIPKNAISN